MTEFPIRRLKKKKKFFTIILYSWLELINCTPAESQIIKAKKSESFSQRYNLFVHFNSGHFGSLVICSIFPWHFYMYSYNIPYNVIWVLSTKMWILWSVATLVPFSDRALYIIIYSELELSIYEVGNWKLSLRFSLNLECLERIYWEALVSLTTSAARMSEQKGKLLFLLRAWMYHRELKMCSIKKHLIKFNLNLCNPLIIVIWVTLVRMRLQHTEEEFTVFELKLRLWSSDPNQINERP